MSIPQGLVGQGYKLLEPGHPRRFKTFGTWEKDGVRVALSSNNFLVVERGKVVIYRSEENDMTLEAINTDAEVRRKGRARQALHCVTALADQTGMTLYLEPVQLDQTGPTRSQLIDFYASAGFKSLPNTDKVMVRPPTCLSGAGVDGVASIYFFEASGSPRPGLAHLKESGKQSNLQPQGAAMNTTLEASKKLASKTAKPKTLSDMTDLELRREVRRLRSDRADVLEALDNATASLENVLLQFGKKMSEGDQHGRGRVVSEAQTVLVKFGKRKA